MDNLATRCGTLTWRRYLKNSSTSLTFASLLQLFQLFNYISAQENQSPNNSTEIYNTKQFSTSVSFPGEFNQDRWRYIPEKNLHGGNILQREMVSALILPDIEYERDIGVVVGISIADFDFLQKRRSETLELLAAHSTEGQQDYEIKWKHYLDVIDIPNQGVFINERGSLFVKTEYQKTLTKRFFGFGPQATSSDETSYTDEIFDAKIGVEHAFPGKDDNQIFRFDVRGDHHHLSSGHVSTAPSTDIAFPDLVRDGNNQTQLWVEEECRYDTRDSLENPYHGYYFGITEASVVNNAHPLKASITTARIGGVHEIPDLIPRLFPLDPADPGSDTLAIDMCLQRATSSIPFYDLPSLGGGSTLRGYISNRWTGRFAWYGSAEYRFWMLPNGFSLSKSMKIARVGLAPFIDVGTVASRWSELLRASVKSSYGIGLRVALDRTSLIRADVGFSREGTEINIDYGLGF